MAPQKPQYSKRAPYLVQASGTHYLIVSRGKDRLPEKLDLWSTLPVATTNFDCDIVYRDGAFVRYVEGIETP